MSDSRILISAGLIKEPLFLTQVLEAKDSRNNYRVTHTPDVSHHNFHCVQGCIMIRRTSGRQKR